MMKLVVLALLFAVVAKCQEVVEDESGVEERKEKRGISLNLGSGLEGYSYLGPSSYSGRNYNRGYTPITEYGYDGVNYGSGASNFAGGYQGGYQQGYYQPQGSYPYRSGYPTSYSNQRQYNTPVNTYPLGGIGTVGPNAAAYGGFNGYTGGFNRFGNDGYGGYQQGFQQGGNQGYY